MTKKLPPDQVKYPRIHENDRHLIEHMWNDEKLTQSEIARKLNRSQSAISRELKQGNIFDFSNLSKRQLYNLEIHSRIKYSALRGQFIATQRSVRRGNGSKLLTDELKELIEHWVNVEHWTPEQIAEAHVSDIEVSASTIRNWARQGKIYLRPYYRKRANNTDAEKVKIKTQYQKQREIDRLRSKLKSQGILVRHSIYERPPKINTRRQFGHWE
ncbi:helix-turn-helix domain-containing protein, partial [Leuconostoc mesenteroides]